MEQKWLDDGKQFDHKLTGIDSRTRIRFPVGKGFVSLHYHIQPTYSPIQRIEGGRSVRLKIHVNLVARLRIRGAVRLRGKDV
jgi:hypothetical protein